ncbi:MAG TPA: hypothetical protein VFM54_23330 [Micromonosporaceae bacterium]|nr:hypothetical protein [Micromonosporaceae bacterium]
MGAYAALAHSTWLGGYDFTTDTNQATLRLSREPLGADVFQVGLVGRSRRAGLQDVQASVAGLWQAGSGMVDPAVIAVLGGTVQPVTQSVSGTEQDVAYLYQAGSFSYEMFGEVGQLTPFSLAIQGARGSGSLSAGAVRGRLLKARGNVSATGATGTAYQLGAVGASQYLYATLHVFGAGTTITAVLESDDNAGFSSATTRMTFGPITTTGGTWGTRVAGPITDDYYRIRVTAITGTFSAGAAAGIK